VSGFSDDATKYVLFAAAGIAFVGLLLGGLLLFLRKPRGMPPEIAEGRPDVCFICPRCQRSYTVPPLQISLEERCPHCGYRADSNVDDAPAATPVLGLRSIRLGAVSVAIAGGTALLACGVTFLLGHRPGSNVAGPGAAAGTLLMQLGGFAVCYCCNVCGLAVGLVGFFGSPHWQRSGWAVAGLIVNVLLLFALLGGTARAVIK
jgi:hypothetical protein